MQERASEARDDRSRPLAPHPHGLHKAAEQVRRVLQPRTFLSQLFSLLGVCPRLMGERMLKAMGSGIRRLSSVATPQQKAENAAAAVKLANTAVQKQKLKFHKGARALERKLLLRMVYGTSGKELGDENVLCPPPPHPPTHPNLAHRLHMHTHT